MAAANTPGACSRARSPSQQTQLGNEPVSPELVLVDPDLARRARRALIVHPHHAAPPSASSSATPRRRLLAVATALIVGCGATTVWLLGGEPAPTPPAPQARSPAPLEEPLRFTWAPVPDAHSYRLGLYRGTTRIYSAETALPELTVPLRWKLYGRSFRLTRGTYRWVVTPRLGASPPFREGKPIVDATYTA